MFNRDGVPHFFWIVYSGTTQLNTNVVKVHIRALYMPILHFICPYLTKYLKYFEVNFVLNSSCYCALLPSIFLWYRLCDEYSDFAIIRGQWMETPMKKLLKGLFLTCWEKRACGAVRSEHFENIKRVKMM